MDFTVDLFEGTDSVKFGMSRDEVQSLLGTKPSLFRKTQFDLQMTEDYAGICHVFYDDIGSVALEFFSPTQVFFNNVQLMGQDRTKIEALLSSLDDYKSEADGFSFYSNDFSFYAPEGKIESVYICRRRYSKEQLDFYTKAYE